MGRLDRILSGNNRLTYLFNTIWIILIARSILIHDSLGILIYGVILFVWNYPWLKNQYYSLCYKYARLKNKRIYRRNGYTLLELLIFIAIIGLMILIAYKRLMPHH